MKNVIVGQSGGPTAVINASLLGVFKTAKDRGADTVYGMVHGIKGLLDRDIVDMSTQIKNDLDMDLLKRTPSSFLGSCRYKLPPVEGNEAVYERIFATLKELRDVTRQIASGKSSLGKMAMDSGEIYTELRTAIDRANSILGAVESGKGSAGKILASDEFYNELRDTVRQLRAAIEDFREMAPVATFGSIAFGAL